MAKPIEIQVYHVMVHGWFWYHIGTTHTITGPFSHEWKALESATAYAKAETLKIHRDY